MFHRCFSSLVTYLPFRFPSVSPCGQLERQSPLFGRSSLFLLLLLVTITRSGCLDDIRWSVRILKSQICNVLHHRYLLVFYWNLKYGKSLQVSKTLLRILADLNNAVVWISLIFCPISNWFSFFFQNFEKRSSAPVTTGITVNFIFGSFSRSLARSKYFSIFPFSFCLTLCGPMEKPNPLSMFFFIFVN